MKHRCLKRIKTLLLSAFLYTSIILSDILPVFAAPASEVPDYLAQADERKSLTVQSNQVENWPEGPAIGAQAAILLEANTGIILYAKNIHEKLYPASTTKLMTCLIAAENSSMDEMVTFSNDAVFSIESGSSNMGIDVGQALPMEECLYGILVASANEVANAVAEHVAGSMDDFTDMMNEKAAELGCRDTHFVNAHGLFDENHYTSAYDLAIIAKAFFQNEQLSRLGNTASHHFEATATQPDDFIVRNKHKLITGEISYNGIKGGKTGYTDEARQTLVTCAEKNGMKLICVILKEESPEQFNDTVKLFDYGFTNFVVTNVAENETRYNIENTRFFHTSNDIFGNSNPILELNKNSYLILPKTVDFADLTSEISYNTAEADEIAEINYYYHNTYVGTATVDFAKENHSSYDFDSEPVISGSDGSEPEASGTAEQRVIFINIKTVLIIVLIVAALLIIIFIIRDILINYSFLGSRKIRKRSKVRGITKRNRDKGPTF